MNRALLDRVAPDNPVSLMDISVHAMWLNSKALQILGITASTPNPPGGIIERNAQGEPTGVLREGARALVQAAIPPPTAEENAKALSWSLHEMLSHGITSFTDAGIEESGLQAYGTLADEGVLKQRVRGCIAWHPNVFGSHQGLISETIEHRTSTRVTASNLTASKSFWTAYRRMATRRPWSNLTPTQPIPTRRVRREC